MAKLPNNYFSGLKNIFGSAASGKSLAAILNSKAGSAEFTAVTLLGTSGTSTVAQLEAKINEVITKLKAGAV
jgi:hypothetical protein